METFDNEIQTIFDDLFAENYSSVALAYAKERLSLLCKEEQKKMIKKIIDLYKPLLRVAEFLSMDKKRIPDDLWEPAVKAMDELNALLSEANNDHREG